MAAKESAKKWRSAAPTTSAPEATSFWALVLGSLGVVYGDIGTSPLYALKESLAAATAMPAPAPSPATWFSASSR